MPSLFKQNPWYNISTIPTLRILFFLNQRHQIVPQIRQMYLHTLSNSSTCPLIRMILKPIPHTPPQLLEPLKPPHHLRRGQLAVDKRRSRRYQRCDRHGQPLDLAPEVLQTEVSFESAVEAWCGLQVSEVLQVDSLVRREVQETELWRVGS